MHALFRLLGAPTRLAILAALLGGERSVGELEGELQLAQPVVSKHLRHLREGGLVEVRVDAQRRLYQLNPSALRPLEAWLAPYRRMWTTHLDALARHLDRHPTSPKRRNNG